MSSMVMNQVIVRLAQRPRGEIVIGEHLVVDRDVPVREQLEDGELLIQVMWLSVDPAMRGWMSSAKSYLPPSPLGEPMRANGVGRVTRSKSDKYDVGTVVSGFLGMQEYAILPEKKIRKVVLPKGVSPRLALGVLGNNGLTAYFGLFEVGHPKPGDTVVVSAAAGATGSIAAQITKSVLGCRTIGIAGGEEKRLWLSNEISLDDAIDYKNDDIGKSLKRTCPDGIDVGNPSETSPCPMHVLFTEMLLFKQAWSQRALDFSITKTIHRAHRSLPSCSSVPHHPLPKRYTLTT
mmetsp:Transcript_42936/g.167851  ORF Transcript_42936/g.167851 Transcript_42936/m.167851 type:complete len:291 (-) Transcript_42936:1422-2294(-)